MSVSSDIAYALRAGVLIARQSFLVMLTNRLRFYTGIFTYLIYILVYASIWRAVSAMPESAPRLAEFGGYPGLLTYIAIGWLSRAFLFNNLDRDVSELIISGNVVTRCMRPVSLHTQMLFAAVGECAFRLLCFAPWIALIVFVFFDVRGPASVEAAVGFAVANVIALVLFAEINYLIGLFAFKTESVQGVMRAKIFLVEILSGLLIPFSYFPDWLRTVAYCTPFPALMSIPARIYGGQVTGMAIVSNVLVAAAWCVALFLLAHFWTRRLVRQVDVG